jgi:hypothetical protein
MNPLKKNRPGKDIGAWLIRDIKWKKIFLNSFV